MMELDEMDITYRGASNFGFQLANNLVEKFENDGVPPSKWPKRFPLTLQQIKELPRIKSDKIARRTIEAARVIWKDMYERAIEMERDMKLHPEFYMAEEVERAHTFEEHLQQWAWRHLSIDIEQIGGNVFVTEFGNEELAKEYVYKNLGVIQIRKNIKEFEDDFENYINEVREAIRAKKYIKASNKLEMICLINTSLQRARKKINAIS